MQKKSIPPSTKNSFLIFFSKNPLAGLIVSIIGILLAIYFYFGSRDFRELIYYVHPVKAAVVITGAASDFSVEYKNQEIKTDVTVVQIAFWNNGNLSIRRNNVLKPFTIQVQKGLPILEVSLRKISRDVTGISIDKSNLKNGVVSLNWEILEHNDGGVIQLIYAGSTDVEITASGIIEGQAKITQLYFPGKIESPSEQYSSFMKKNKAIGYVLIIFAILMFLAVLQGWVHNKSFVIRDNNNKYNKIMLFMTLFLLILCLFFLGSGIYFLLNAQSGVPFNI